MGVVCIFLCNHASEVVAAEQGGDLAAGASGGVVAVRAGLRIYK